MKTTSYLIIVFAIILLAGCHHAGRIKGDSLTNIRLGMSKQEVISILREPRGVSANEKFETYRYYVDHGHWRLTHYEFIFIDDKLKLFGIPNTYDFKIKVETISK